MKLQKAINFFLGVMLSLTVIINASSNYKYSYIPKKVYINQLFPVTVIGIGKNDNKTPLFQFNLGNKPIFKEPLIVHNGNDSFYTFYFKAKNSDIYIPSLIIKDNTLTSKLKSRYIPIKKLKGNNDFSNILATDLKIKNSQVSNYDENNYIITLNIEAYEANLEDMSLKNVIESGIENIKRKFSKVSGEFYVVVPSKQKLLHFTYFNTLKREFISKKVSINLKDTTVSTQSELNPKEDSFEKLKKYTLFTLIIFFFIMFLLKIDFFYLILSTISLITLLTLYIPHKTICVSQGTPLYILPTYTSDISTTIDTKFKTMLLSERKGYKKVKYKNGIIGWIKDEDICKN